MKKLTIISLGLILLFSCSGPTSELKATRNTRDGIIPFDAAVLLNTRIISTLNSPRETTRL